MSPRCTRCGRFDYHLTERITQPANGYQGEESEALCPRCLRLAQRGWTVCYEEVADRDGTAQPCDRPAFGQRMDPESLRPYPVCRNHHRPPFRLCRWQSGDRSRCIEHDAPWPMGEDWCNLAFEVAS
jgi:hypothetical protein